MTSSLTTFRLVCCSLLLLHAVATLPQDISSGYFLCDKCSVNYGDIRKGTATSISSAIAKSKTYINQYESIAVEIDRRSSGSTIDYFVK